MKNNVSFNSSLSKFGIGLFETIKVLKKPIGLDLHMDRLFNSIHELNIKTDIKRNFLEQEILKYINENKIKNKALRVTVFDEGYNISSRDILYNDRMYNEGIRLTISPIKRGYNILNKHKTTNYFENIYTKEDALEKGYNDGLFLDTNDKILECSMSNIFFIKNNKIYTPSDELSILNGTKRKIIFKICKDINIEIKEIYIKKNDLSSFEFTFVTNSLMGAMKVSAINDIHYDENNDIFNTIVKELNLWESQNEYK